MTIKQLKQIIKEEVQNLQELMSGKDVKEYSKLKNGKIIIAMMESDPGWMYNIQNLITTYLDYDKPNEYKIAIKQALKKKLSEMKERNVYDLEELFYNITFKKEKA